MKPKNKMKEKKEKFYLPKKIDLLGSSYKIILKNCRCKKCDSEHAGMISFNKGEIELHKNLNESEKEYVMFHELAHFFADYYRLENTEMFADAFAKYIAGIIKQLGYVKK